LLNEIKNKGNFLKLLIVQSVEKILNWAFPGIESIEFYCSHAVKFAHMRTIVKDLIKFQKRTATESNPDPYFIVQNPWPRPVLEKSYPRVVNPQAFQIDSIYSQPSRSPRRRIVPLRAGGQPIGFIGLQAGFLLRLRLVDRSPTGRLPAQRENRAYSSERE
jgi:hypothetical protein